MSEASKQNSIHLGLPVAIIGLSAACLLAMGIATVNKISDLTRERVYGEALDLVALRAKEIEGFFAERGRVAVAVFANPVLLDWFAGYDQFRRPLDRDEDYESINAYFNSVVAADPSIVSVFFATDSTGEYFREYGRVEREGYDPKQRWWWLEAVAKDRLYVSQAGVDAGTGDVSVTVQSTIYRADGRLLGVGGIDVLLGTLGALVEGITYEGVGDAFLVSDAGQLIYFPGLEFSSEAVGTKLATQLAEVDELFDKTSGFAELERRFTDRTPGLALVRWRGDDRIVMFHPVRDDLPELDWTLGLMVPEELIAASIRRTRQFTALAILLAVTGIAGVTLFVTRRIERDLREEDRRRAEALAEANARLREADQMKSQFLANMSHELRTPLNSIIGFSEILRSRLAERIDDRHLRFLDNINLSGQHLLSIITDILDLSKVEAGRMELHPEPIEVPLMLRGVGAIVRGMCKEKSITVRIDAPPDLPFLNADPVRVKQILFNLLSNAVKFSPSGSVVKVVARAVAAQQSSLGLDAMEVAVIDQGIGISPQDQRVIFDEFRQLDGKDHRRYAGTGLGLALVRRLVELHCGVVQVESEVELGSVFRVTLPLAFHGDATPLPRVPGDDLPEGPTILVVEDDVVAYEAIRRDLTEAGYRTVASHDGSDAVELAVQLKPAAIVLDIILPAADGWEVLRELKGLEETGDIPVIIVSVLDNHELGMALGADAYFSKPLERVRFLSRLDELVPTSDSERPRLLLIDDDPQVHELLDELLGPAGYELDHAVSGAEGLEMVRRQPPDLVVLDLMMDEMDGFEVAERLEGDPATRHIPVVVLTARETAAEDRKRLRGKIEALVKKRERGDLVPVIRRLLR